MASSAVIRTNREFDDFLQAPVSAPSDQMPLSVLSALTRLDVDPWGEASELSKLSKEKAINRLEQLIARIPPMASATVDGRAVATRLVELLPHGGGANPYPGIPGAGSKFSTVVVKRAVMALAIFLLGVAAVLLSMTRD